MSLTEQINQLKYIKKLVMQIRNTLNDNWLRLKQIGVARILIQNVNNEMSPLTCKNKFDHKNTLY